VDCLPWVLSLIALPVTDMSKILTGREQPSTPSQIPVCIYYHLIARFPLPILLPQQAKETLGINVCACSGRGSGEVTHSQGKAR
jgi:hypothetical protein